MKTGNYIVNKEVLLKKCYGCNKMPSYNIIYIALLWMVSDIPSPIQIELETYCKDPPIVLL